MGCHEDKSSVVSVVSSMEYTHTRRYFGDIYIYIIYISPDIKREKYIANADLVGGFIHVSRREKVSRPENSICKDDFLPTDIARTYIATNIENSFCSSDN